jgi:Uri superfamily endonuclease
MLGDRGLYEVAFLLATESAIRPGALDQAVLAPGWYVYTGSARRNLRARVARHLRGSANLRWHIDYLRACVRPVAWRLHPLGSGTECDLVEQAVSTGQAIRHPRGFGSSDCRCGGHLTHHVGPPPWVAPQ